MYAIEELTPGLWQIRLPSPHRFPHQPLSEAINVYLLCRDSGAATLIHTGDTHQSEALFAALDSIGISPYAITRILSTSWMPHMIAGAQKMPWATLALWSPNLIQPAQYNRWVTQAIAPWRSLSEALATDEKDREEIKEFWDRYMQDVPQELLFLPLREGFSIDAGGWSLQVLASPGPQEGHAVFWAPQERLLFAGEMVFEGWPSYMESMEEYMASASSLQALEPGLVLPNRGFVAPAHKLHRNGRFLQNFISNIPHILNRGQTIEDVVMEDLGYRPSSTVKFAVRARTFQTLLDDLVRAKLIAAQGEGLARQYGDQKESGSVGARMVQVKDSSLVVPQLGGQE